MGKEQMKKSQLWINPQFFKDTTNEELVEETDNEEVERDFNHDGEDKRSDQQPDFLKGSLTLSSQEMGEFMRKKREPEFARKVREATKQGPQALRRLLKSEGFHM